MLGFLYSDDLSLYVDLEENLKAMVKRFVEVCSNRVLKVNEYKSKLIVLTKGEGLECEVSVDGMRLKHMSEFKYFECALDESSTDDPECSRNVVGMCQ